jgi:hypothetical protein
MPTTPYRQFSTARVSVVSADTGDNFDIPMQDVMQVTITNSLSSPGPSFTLVLKAGAFQSVDYSQELGADDFIQITLGDGHSERLEIIGMIDRIAESRVVEGDGATVRRFLVNGKNLLGKILTTIEFFTDRRLEGIGGKTTEVLFKLVNAFSSIGRQFGASFTPDSIIPTIIEAYAGVDGQYVHPTTNVPYASPRSGLVDYLQYVTAINSLAIGDSLFNISSGMKLWPIIDKYSDRVLNEFYFDLLPVNTPAVLSALSTTSLQPQAVQFGNAISGSLLGQGSVGFKPQLAVVRNGPYTPPSKVVNPSSFRICMVLREHPYDIDTFFGSTLDEYTVTTDEILDSNFGKSDADVVNMVKVVVSDRNIPSDTLDLAVIPKVLPSSIAKHGIRRMYTETGYLQDANSVVRNTSGIGARLARLTAQVFGWHVMNDSMRNGTVQLGHLRNDIRIGNRVKVLDGSGAGYVYYVEGTSHTFSYPGTATTSLALSRGIPPKGTTAHDIFLNQRNARLAEAGG